MSYNSKYTGEQVEQLLDQVANGEAAELLPVYGDGYIESEQQDDGVYLTTNVAENLDEVSKRGQLADAYDVKTFVENAVQGGAETEQGKKEGSPHPRCRLRPIY